MASMITLSDDGNNEGYVVMDSDNWTQNTVNLLNTQPGVKDNSAIIHEDMILVEEPQELYEIEEIEHTNQEGAAEIIDMPLTANDVVDLPETGGDSGDDDEEVYMDTMEEVMNIAHLTNSEKMEAALHVKLVGARTYELNIKKQFKEFLKTCSANIEFNELTKMFASTLPSCNPIYALAHDKLPDNFSPKCKYAIVCSANGCENAYYRNGSNWDSIEQTKNFFGFPPDENRCSEWIKAIGRKKYLKKTILEMQTYRICEDHFAPEDFTNEFREDLCDSAVPSLLLHGDEAVEEQPEIESDFLDESDE